MPSLASMLSRAADPSRLDARQARSLVSFLQRRHKASMTLVALASAGLVTTNWMGACWLLFQFQRHAPGAGLNLAGTPVLVASIVGFALVLLPGPLVGLFLRDLWLRTLLRSHLQASACWECGYPLVEPVMAHLPITCPECGAAHQRLGPVAVPAVVVARGRARRSIAVHEHARHEGEQVR